MPEFITSWPTCEIVPLTDRRALWAVLTLATVVLLAELRALWRTRRR